MNRVVKKLAACFLFAFLSAVSAPGLFAQEWAEKMVDKATHDFGTVARGADTVYRFEITNLYKQTLEITGVRSSCGCTTPTIEHPVIKTHEKAYIVARFNTNTFVGRHGATLTISIGPSPYLAEIQVRVDGNIRGDVVFSPGAVDFGDVDQGSSKEQLLTVNYAGRNNWEITDVTNDNDFFEVELKETTRQSRKVSYKMLVRLKENVPAGLLKDQLSVVTNDRNRENQRFPLIVSARVLPEISVNPEVVVLGDVEPGSTVTRKIVVRGKQPFRILSVDCGDDCFTFNAPEEAKAMHLVEMTYQPGDNPGMIEVPVKVTTDRGENFSPTFTVSATVAPTTRPAAQAQADAQSGTLDAAGVLHSAARN